jgi:hypothetical protein
MNKRTRDWLIFAAAIALGLWLGRLLRPSPDKIGEKINFEPIQAPAVFCFHANFPLRTDAACLTLKQSAPSGFVRWPMQLAGSEQMGDETAAAWSASEMGWLF